MSTEENKASVRRLMEEGWNRRNLAVVDELVAEEYVNHGYPPGTPPGREAARRFWATALAAAEDWHLSIEDMVAEGDKVAYRFMLRFTQTGDFFGVPATGKSVALCGIAIDRFRYGRMVEEWQQEDILGLLQQLGALPTPVRQSAKPAFLWPSL